MRLGLGVEGARNSGKEVPPKRPSAMEEIFSLAPGTMPLQNWGWENMACVEKEDTRSATAVARNSIDQLMLFGGNLVGLKKEVSGEEKLASKFVSKPNKKVGFSFLASYFELKGVWTCYCSCNIA
jgi:hypothetical protein